MIHVVGGRYALIAHLGGGAVSDVSLAKLAGESDAAKVVVVKRLKFGADAEPKISAQFAAEARLATQLNHPNIVQAIEASEDDDGPFLVLEYLEGVPLARLRSRATRRAGGLPRKLVLHIIAEVATALAYAHAFEDASGKSLRLVHRDLSPENIIVGYDGTTRLIDFGLPVAGPAEARAAGMKGNLAYVAPEQARVGVTLDARADVFALGVVLWELLAGRRMWEGSSESDVLGRLGDGIPLPSVRTVAPDVPEELEAICAQALAKIRDDRFDSAFQLREAIDKASNTPELRTTTGEVADFVTKLFDDEREKMRTIIADAVGRPATASPSRPRVSVAPPRAADPFFDMDSDPRLPIASLVAPAPSEPAVAPPAPPSAPAEAPPAAPSEPSLPSPLATPLPSSPSVTTTPVPAPRVVEVLRIEHGPSRDRRFAYAMGAAIAVAFASVAVVAMTHKSEPKAEEGVVARRRLQATEAPAPIVPKVVESAAAEPEEITVEIRVTPPAARIFVDGVKAANNPHRLKVARGKFPHEIRAEAEGFLPYSTTLPFDRDRTVDVALPPKPRGGAPQGGQPASRSGSDNPY